MIAFRRAHPILSREQFYTDAEIEWFDPHGGLPKWTDPKARQLACLVHESGQSALYLQFNASAEEADFRLPPRPDGVRWHLAADTGREAPQGMSRARGNCGRSFSTRPAR